jgi:VIT1/CCC1 family predicted Fe2+/Mn2+ transporter
MPHLHAEWHKSSRIGWLRAAVLGANDGVISTASLMVGVAATGRSPSAVLTAGVAGLAAGAMSMAAGEYVSVQSQADTERADIARETRELETQPELERAELVAIYRKRGLEHDLATQVAAQLMAHDALGAHVRDELGITETLRARPLQAAMAPRRRSPPAPRCPSSRRSRPRRTPRSGSRRSPSSPCWVSAALRRMPAARRCSRARCAFAFWGALAMALTAGVGRLFGTAV